MTRGEPAGSKNAKLEAPPTPPASLRLKPSRPPARQRVATSAVADNDPFRALMRENLVLEGQTVIEAHDGKAGLDLFRQGGADLVITDVLMPEKEGLTVLMELRNAHPPVNVIAISGGGQDYLVTATLLGAAKVLVKPFPIAVLIAAINELMLGDR